MTASRENVSFLNNFWAADKSGMDNLLNYMYSTHDELKQLHTVYRMRAQLEYEYSRSLLDLASPFADTQKKVYHTLHLELKQTSLSHLELSNLLQSDVAFHLRNKLDEYELLLEKWRMTLEALYNEREQLTLKLLKIQAKYLKEQDLSNGKGTPSHEALKDKYRYSVAQVNNISKEWNVVWTDACRTLEAMEEDRVEFTKVNMWDYANKISESLLVQDNWCENIRQALEKYAVQQEIMGCIENYRTGTHIPTTKDYVDEVYQSQKAKKNRKGNLRQSLGLKKQQSMISTKNERENIAESVETSKTIGHFTQGNDIYHRTPSIRKIEQSNLTKNLQQLSRSDSSNLPRQPYEYKPDTGSFPSIKGNVDSSPLGNDANTSASVERPSTTGLPLPINNMPAMIAPKSPRPSPRPSPYSSSNIADHYSFGQSYPPSSYVQPQQAFSNPCLMPQPIPRTTHPRQHHYKSAPCSPVHVCQPYGNSFW